MADQRPVPMRARRQKGARTEELFRDAGRRVFARDGFLAAKVEDIAAEAGKSPASFYNYFENKHVLLAAIAQDFHEETRTTIAGAYREGATAEENVREAITVWVRNYREKLGVMSGVFQASMIDPEFLARWQAIRSDAIRFIARGVEEAQREGWCPGADPLLTASALSSMLEHFCYVWIAQGGDDLDVTFDEAKAVDALFGIWFHAIYWK